MDEIEIKIVEAKIIKTPLASCLHMLRGVESIPQLGCDKELLPLADSSFDGSPYS